VVPQLETIMPRNSASNARRSVLPPQNGVLRVPSADEVMVRIFDSFKY